MPAMKNYIVEIDSQPIAKRIVNDLMQSARPRKHEPVTFQAKWIAATKRFPATYALDDKVPDHSRADP